MWLFSLTVAAGSPISGAIIAIFRRARLFGIAFLSAGLGGLVTGGIFFLSWIASAS